jgi:uptake hydrogenase large subunit
MNPALDAATGALHIAARGTPAGLVAVEVRNTRPAAAHALRGLEVAQACTRVPRLYSLCAHAQAGAARAACAAAAGSPQDEAARRADEHALAAESAREHLWRLMLDWPALLALPPALQADWRARFAALYRRLAAPADGASSSTADTHPACADAPTTAGRSALAARLAEDLSALADELAATLPAALTSALDPPLLDSTPQARRDAPVARAGFLTALLPALDALACARRLALDEAFAAAPQLDGLCRETGALARHHADAAVAAALAQGRRLAARILARIADLRESALALAGESRSTTRARSELALPAPSPAPRIDACSPAPGVGLARVDSARGLLIHQVRLAAKPAGEPACIADYHIIAPTEWNFHPQGVFVREALATPPMSAAHRQRRLRALALALDPCVAVSWGFEESGDA